MTQFSRGPVSARLTTLAASNTPVMTKLALSKISEMLVSSPTERAAFAKDPSGYFHDRFGVQPSDHELQYLKNLQELVADGLCCGGCACGAADFGGMVANPGLRGG